VKTRTLENRKGAAPKWSWRLTMRHPPHLIVLCDGKLWFVTEGGHENGHSVGSTFTGTPPARAEHTLLAHSHSLEYQPQTPRAWVSP